MSKRYDFEFEGRPDHRDYWLLASLVSGNDREIDEGEGLVRPDDVMSRIIDPERLTKFLIDQFMHNRLPTEPTTARECVDAWLGGFKHGHHHAVTGGNKHISMANLKAKAAESAEMDLAEVVDIESVTYMAQQRVLRVEMAMGMKRVVLPGLWFDGFATGAMYAQTPRERDIPPST